MSADAWLFTGICNALYLMHLAESWWWRNIRMGGSL